MRIPRLPLVFVLCCGAALSLRGQSATQGLVGHLAVTVNNGIPRPGFTDGISFYSAVYPVEPSPTASTQFGWGAWVIPDNATVTQPLCPPGTVAGDNFHDRAASLYRDVFQTIEGGMGRWANTHFPSTVPKYRINAVPDCYDTQIGSPGWSFGGHAPLPENRLGLAQLSNRLLIAPDGLPFTGAMDKSVFGAGWIPLPLLPAGTSTLGVPTGDRNWTLFFNGANFKGPVAFFVPEIWSALSAAYAADVGRGHDTRPGFINNIALELGNGPVFTAQDQNGVRYRRVPKMTFDVDASGKAILQQDLKFYSKDAVWDAIAAWVQNGTVATQLNAAATFTPALQGASAPLKLDGDPIVFDPGTFAAGVVQTPTGAQAFGMQWSGVLEPGAIPEYYREQAGSWRPVPVSQVPAETGLTQQTFAPAPQLTLMPLDVSSSSPWSSTSWSSGPFTVVLSDSSSLDYVWYRFVDQPAIARLGLSDPDRQRLQTFVESLHQHSGVNGITIPPPSSGNLATLDPGLIVTPPAGLEKGYVPIVIRQYKPLPAAEIEALEAFYRATNGAAWTNSTNWLRGTAESWHGVTIENGHVAGISLVSNNLTGTLPPEIGNLPALRFLELSLNSIGGPIPPQLGSLAALESFGMFANRLTGPIPAEIGTLTRLTRLELGSNQLTGSLPRSLGQLTALRFLLLGNNQLEGLLPSELGNLSQLTLLHLWTNRFSGPLPLSLAQLTKMQEFHFQNTGLCMPTDAGLQAWLSSISNLVSTNLSCTSGTVVITARVQSKGVDAGGPYVDIAFTNTGTGDALNTTVTSLEFKTLAGRGVVTSAASVPLALDTIAPQTSIVVRVNLSVPRTVARFSITEGVVATSAQGDALSFSLVQPVTAGTMRLELGRRNAHGND